MATKLTLENVYGRYSIEDWSDDKDLPALIDDLVAPVLRAAGYDQESIDSCLLSPQRGCVCAEYLAKPDFYWVCPVHGGVQTMPRDGRDG